MLIDDENIIVESLKKTIAWESLNCQVIATASNGREAIELYNKYKPDIVITDIKMPDMSGIDFLVSIVPERKSDKIIVLSGYDEFSFARAALKYKAYQYLLKPIDREELYQVIQQAIIEIEEEKQMIHSTDKQKIYEILIRKIDISEQLDDFNFHEYGVVIVENVNSEDLALEDVHTKDTFMYVYHQNKSRVVIVFGSIRDVMSKIELVAKEKILDTFPEAIVLVGTVTDKLKNLNHSYEFAVKLTSISSFVDSRMITVNDYNSYQELTNDSAEVLKQAKEYIETHYQKDVTNESVAKHFGFSPSYFSTLFKKYHGLTFIDHLTNVRIKHACRLLEDTKKPTYLIANLVGYEDQRYFSQVFKRKMGLTPSAYRKDHSNE